MNYKDINQVINLHHVNESDPVKMFMSQLEDRLSYPKCKFCNNHVEKFRRDSSKGVVCKKCRVERNRIVTTICRLRRKKNNDKMLLEYRQMYTNLFGFNKLYSIN